MVDLVRKCPDNEIDTLWNENQFAKNIKRAVCNYQKNGHYIH